MAQISIDKKLVEQLITQQIPQWQHLAIQPVTHGGWDNRTFHLGDRMLVRMPSAAEYAAKVEKEQHWLPILAPLLPLQIPTPLFMGKPSTDYPWEWSVYAWIEGEAASHTHIDNINAFAQSLATFLKTLHTIDTTHGPQPGPHNFYRGGSLNVYDAQTRQAIEILKDKIDSHAATKIWESALATSWNQPPVWVHGDISLGNLLVHNRQLHAAIDFGGLAIGDPACDLAIAWTFFRGEYREIFRTTLALDEGTWVRGQAWALWKALIIAAGIVQTNAVEGKKCWEIIDEINRS